jgi:predicted RNA-binding protein (virulence factor B family)
MPRHLLLTLEYYLLKTQEMQSSLQELMEDTIRSGMKVETFHLSNTQSRLAATMALIKPLFRQSGM